MTSDPRAQAVFEDVEADPDAVLDAFDETPEAIVADAGDGAHEPTTDDTIDVDDALASELFDDLAEVDTEPTAADAADGDRGRAEADRSTTARHDGFGDDAEVHAGAPTVVVEEGGAAAIDDFFETIEANEPSTAETADRSGDEPTLVGPGPDRVRVEGDGRSVDDAVAADPSPGSPPTPAGGAERPEGWRDLDGTA